MVPCSEKNLSVQVVITIWVTEANRVLNVAILKGGKVCLGVKCSIAKWEEILSSLVFLHVFFFPATTHDNEIFHLRTDGTVVTFVT